LCGTTGKKKKKNDNENNNVDDVDDDDDDDGTNVFLGYIYITCGPMMMNIVEQLAKF
jgi:hypothetical protein